MKLYFWSESVLWHQSFWIIHFKIFNYRNIKIIKRATLYSKNLAFSEAIYFSESLKKSTRVFSRCIFFLLTNDNKLFYSLQSFSNGFEPQLKRQTICRNRTSLVMFIKKKMRLKVSLGARVKIVLVFNLPRIVSR